jgi:hypothetical protein
LDIANEYLCRQRQKLSRAANPVNREGGTETGISGGSGELLGVFIGNLLG